MAGNFSTAFETLPAHRVPRRVFLVIPVALVGMYALIRQPQRELPDPAADGNGLAVRLILFSRTGERNTAISVHKIIKADAQWRGELNSDEYAVTRRAATEVAFNNRYWNNRDAGIYRCICCADALFRSEDKFNSGTGWPSFTRPIAGENVTSGWTRAWLKSEMRCYAGSATRILDTALTTDRRQPANAIA